MGLPGTGSILVLMKPGLILLAGAGDCGGELFTDKRHPLLGKNPFGCELKIHRRKDHFHDRLSHEEGAGGLAFEFDDHATLPLMNGLSILVRRMPITALLASIAVLGLGCSPKMDWREIRQEAIGAKALFPAKPVEVSRTLPSPDGASPFTLTLKSARIDQTMFALGWVIDGPENARSLLEAAMLANIQADAASIQREHLMIGKQQIHELQATGSMRPDASSPTVPARLWMRSLVAAIPASQGKGSTITIEIIAVGPAQQLREEDARQFIESLSFSQ